MGYAPVVHAKETRMSTLIVDDNLNMGDYTINSLRVYGVPLYSDPITIPTIRNTVIRSSFITERDKGVGTTIYHPASTAVFTLAASDEIRASDLSTPYEGFPTTYTKISELEVPIYYKGGTVRVKVSAGMDYTGNGAVQFYVDGIEAGPVHPFTTSVQTYSDDIEVTPGALIQVYGKTSDNKIVVKDFQICADDVIHNGIKGALW